MRRPSAGLRYLEKNVPINYFTLWQEQWFSFICIKGVIDTENKSLPVELWVKHVTLGGALEPDMEEWRSVNGFVVQQGLAIPDRTFEQFVAHADDWLSELKEMQIESSSNITGEDFALSWFHNADEPNSVISDGGQEPDDQPEISGQVKKSKSKRVIHETITEWKPAKPLEKLELRIIPSNVDHDNMIYFHEEDKTDTLKQIELALLQKYKDSKPQPQDMFWSVGQPCIALYHSNSMWYRGKIIKVNDDSTYIVQFVDYGNVEECKAYELRKRVFLTDLPLYCHTLYLDDLKPVSEEGKWPVPVLDFIHSNVVEKVCDVKLKEPKQPGGSYIATSLAPPGGIELRDILFGMHYAVPASDLVSSSGSDDDDSNSDVVILESKEQEEDADVIEHKQIDESSLAFLTQKWVDNSKDQASEKVASLFDQTVDEVLASITPSDAAGFSELTNSNIEKSLSRSSNSSYLGANSSDAESITSLSVKGLPINSSEISELTLQSIMLEGGEPIDEIFSHKINIVVPEEEKEPVFSKSSKDSRRKLNEFGDFLELPIPQCEELSVEVTAIVSLTSFFVQITQTSDEFLKDIHEQYIEMYKEIQEEAPSGRALLQPLRIGQECVALYDDDENWYRAVIASDLPDIDQKVMVRFVDFGNQQATPVGNLRPLKRKWLDIPRQCFRVTIHDVVPNEDADFATVFDLLTENIFCPLTAIIKDYVSPLSVQLFKEGTKELVYQPLIDAGVLVTK